MQDGPWASDPGATGRPGAELPSPALAARASGGAVGVEVMEGGRVESWLPERPEDVGDCGGVAFRVGVPQGERADTVAGPRPRAAPLSRSPGNALRGARVSAGVRVRFDRGLGRPLRLWWDALRHRLPDGLRLKI